MYDTIEAVNIRVANQKVQRRSKEEKRCTRSPNCSALQENNRGGKKRRHTYV